MGLTSIGGGYAAMKATTPWHRKPAAGRRRPRHIINPAESAAYPYLRVASLVIAMAAGYLLASAYGHKRFRE